MTYDTWKTRSPDDERQDDEPPFYCAPPYYMHCADMGYTTQCKECERLEREQIKDHHASR